MSFQTQNVENPPFVAARRSPILPRADFAEKPFGRLYLVWIFLLGVGIYIHFRIGARVSLSELLLAAAMPKLLLDLPKYGSNLAVRNIVLFATVYCAGILISDYTNSVETFETFKGIATPVIIASFLLLFYIVFQRGENRRIIETFFWGMALGSLLHLIFNTADDEFDFDESSGYTFFVFRIGPVLLTAVSLLLYYSWNRYRIVAYVALVVASFISFYAGSRTLGAGFALVIFLLSLSTISRSNRQTTKRLLVRSVILLLAGGMLCIQAYLFLGANGYLGEWAQRRLEDQSGERGFAQLLQVGRPELIGCGLMIMDKPLLGHGSSSQRSHYFYEAYNMVGRSQYAISYAKRALHSFSNGGHSIYFGAWANTGVFALPFWTLITWHLLLLVTITPFHRIPYTALLLPSNIFYLWEMVGSPMAVQGRALIPFLVACSIVILSKGDPRQPWRIDNPATGAIPYRL